MSDNKTLPATKARWIEAATKRLEHGMDELRGATDAGLSVEPLYEPHRGDSPIPRRAPRPLTTFLAYRHWDYRRVIESLRRDTVEGAWVYLDRSTRVGAPHRGEPVHVGVSGTVVATANELRELASATTGTLVIDPGANHMPVAALVDCLGEPERVSVAFDPLGSWARDGMLPSSLHDLYGEARTAPARVVVSTLPYHDAGCDEVMEVAYALATAAEYVRDLGDEDGDDVFRGELHFRVGVGTDVFIDIAKMRALRWTWSKLSRASGNGQAGQLHAVSSLRSDSKLEPWTNSLRATAAAFAAQVAGADSFCPHSYDELSGRPSALGRRVARNLIAILTAEGQLARVWDPSAGSGYVEALTEQIARSAWQQFRAIEAAGGMTSALAEGRIQEEVDTAWKKLQDTVRDERVLVGVNQFSTDAPPLEDSSEPPDLDEISARFDDDEPLELETWHDATAAARRGANLDQLADLRRGYAAAIEPLSRRRLAPSLGWESEDTQ